MLPDGIDKCCVLEETSELSNCWFAMYLGQDVCGLCNMSHAICPTTLGNTIQEHNSSLLQR